MIRLKGQGVTAFSPQGMRVHMPYSELQEMPGSS
jgi:hypothetical protein